MLAMRHKGDQSGISGTDELDQMVRFIGRLDLAIEANETEMNVRIQQAKQAALECHQGLAAQRSDLLVRVQAYVAAHREEVLKGKAKTRKFNFGTLGWRKLPDKIAGVPQRGTHDMDVLVEALKMLVPTNPETLGTVTIHTERYLMKSDLKKLADEDLVTLGLLREHGSDEFFVDTDKSKLREVESGTGN